MPNKSLALAALGLGCLLAGCTPTPDEPNIVQTQSEARKAAGREAVASGTPAPVQGEGPAGAAAGTTPSPTPGP